jgi:glucan phosphoethanolaminetransferase (alkaline phosphatase superfamily)
MLTVGGFVNMKPKLYLIIVWLLFLTIDIVIVRDLSWLEAQLHGERFWANFAPTSFALLAVLYLIRRFLLQTRTRKIIAFFILYVPLIVQSTHFEIYRIFVSPFGFDFFVENPLLTMKLWIENANYVKIVALVFLVLLGLYLLEKFPVKRSPWPLIGSGVFLTAVFVLSLLSWYSIAKFQNSIIAYTTNMLVSMKIQNAVLPTINRPEIPRPEGNHIRPNIVYIIGESMITSHMSLYGYQRDTTPNLKKLLQKKVLVAFKNAVSIGTKTLVSLPYMLVGLQGIDPDGLFFSYPTIFNYAKAAGYRTAYISAQDVQWGRLDKFIIDKDVDHYRSGVDYNPSTNVSKGADDLVMLEKGIIPYLKTVKEPFLLVVQMDGSHYPYSKHSPQQYKKFLPEEDEDGVNAYDNTLVYSDVYLYKLYNAIRQKDKKAWIFFSPDHGQNLGGDDGFFNERYSKNTIHNPLLVFPPPSAFPRIRANESSPVSQADIAATILDLMHMTPVKPLDAQSLLQPIGPSRLRVCSSYMPTFHNKPTAVLIFEDLSYYHINFRKMRVTLRDGKTIVPFSKIEKSLQAPFIKRLPDDGK